MDAFDGEVCGHRFGGEDGQADEIGVVAGVVGFVVGVDGDEVDADFVWDPSDKVWLEELSPKMANLAFAGHLVSVIGSGR